MSAHRDVMATVWFSCAPVKASTAGHCCSSHSALVVARRLSVSDLLGRSHEPPAGIQVFGPVRSNLRLLDSPRGCDRRGHAQCPILILNLCQADLCGLPTHLSVFPSDLTASASPGYLVRAVLRVQYDPLLDLAATSFQNPAPRAFLPLLHAKATNSNIYTL